MSRIVVIGAGRQGVAAAYDLASVPGLKNLHIVDFSLETSQNACEQVNRLIGSESCTSGSVDASNIDELRHLLSQTDLAIASAPYKLNPNISHAGIDVGCHVVDMGLDTPDAISVHSRSEEAISKGVSIITDCGVAPGLVNIIAYKLIQTVPKVFEVKLYCGGLPEKASPPFFHQVGFSVESLIGEYVDTVESLKNGQIVHENALQDFEEINFSGIGVLEAVTTSGGTGTAPYDLVGKLRTYEYKTLRYPGHWQAMSLLQQGGFWDEEPLIGNVSPYQMSAALMQRQMVVHGYQDIVVARVEARSETESAAYELVDKFDPRTGFTAMQRTTGFSTAIVARRALQGDTPAGCLSCERAVDPDVFIDEAHKRNIIIRRT